MKCYLISDNTDTQMGMRLAGVTGVVVHEREEIMQALDAAAQDKSIAIVLITKKLTELCGEEVADFKLNSEKPMIVEIPDRHGDSHIADTIAAYVGEAIGFKI